MWKSVRKSTLQPVPILLILVVAGAEGCEWKKSRIETCRRAQDLDVERFVESQMEGREFRCCRAPRRKSLVA